MVLTSPICYLKTAFHHSVTNLQHTEHTNKHATWPSNPARVHTPQKHAKCTNDGTICYQNNNKDAPANNEQHSEPHPLYLCSLVLTWNVRVGPWYIQYKFTKMESFRIRKRFCKSWRTKRKHVLIAYIRSRDRKNILVENF